MNTPFGVPSDALVEGKVGNVTCILLSRHGRKHDISPSNINYRANLWALMQQGWILFCFLFLICLVSSYLFENFFFASFNDSK